MAEVEFSWMSSIYDTNSIGRVFQAINVQNGTQYRPQLLVWSNAWTDLVRMALYGHGPDVSEIGTTWVGDLVGMNSLHAFTRAELESLGGPEPYLKGAWQSCVIGAEGTVWAIPWLADTRLLYYRRDVLQKAGINETGAFKTHAAMKTTLQRLKDYGVPVPFVIPTGANRVALQGLASLVWEAGGDFISKDGKVVLLDLPGTRAGFYQYFELGQYLVPQARNVVDVNSDAMYYSDQAAVTISGPWLLRDRNANPQVVANSGVTFPPGVPFVGGSNLVIWKHSRFIKDSLALIRFLISLPEQQFYLKSTGLLPVRLGVLSSPDAARDPLYKALNQGFEKGRTFHMFHLWGLVEDRLTTTIGSIWHDLLANPEASVKAVVDKRLNALSRQLDLVLNSK
jgi:multiple sugar transport system substrate-binding protein